MNPTRTQAKILALLAAFILSPWLLRAEQEPSVDELLQILRNNRMAQIGELRARLRTDQGVEVPFTLSTDGEVVRYVFTDPDQELQLTMDGSGSELRERVDGRMVKVKPERYCERVRGTPVAYEDLALQVLYWPRVKLLGSERVSVMDAWKLEMQGPPEGSQYGAARVWVDKKSGQLIKIEGFGRDGGTLKRFEAKSVQKINGVWMLRQMRVETFDPETHKLTGRTYLEVLGKAD